MYIGDVFLPRGMLLLARQVSSSGLGQHGCVVGCNGCTSLSSTAHCHRMPQQIQSSSFLHPRLFPHLAPYITTSSTPQVGTGQSHLCTIMQCNPSQLQPGTNALPAAHNKLLSYLMNSNFSALQMGKELRLIILRYSSMKKRQPSLF